MAVDRLWLTEPRRATCLAEVAEVRGRRFAVDRALFAPRSRACRHPQPADKGTVWIDGEKRKLQSVQERAGRLWYTLRGTTPAVGDRLQCELDQARRERVSRAHTAMHLLIHALDTPMARDPEVRGGGHIRLTFSRPVPPPDLAAALKRVQSAVAADTPVTRDFAAKAEAGLTPQPFDPPDPVPGPDVVPVVRVAGTAYPCDGTHADRTGRVGRVVVKEAHGGRDGFVVVAKAL